MPSATRSQKREEAASWIDRGALLLIVLALVARATLQIDIEDIGMHLATARVAATSGWPTTNFFSSSYPDYPLFQQYPIYQAAVALVYHLAGWNGLSILNIFLWSSLFCLWIQVAGGWRHAARHHGVWLIPLLAMYPRMMLRPEVTVPLILGCMLLILDKLKSRSRRTPRALCIATLIGLHWTFVNCHPLFPYSLGLVSAVFMESLLRQVSYFRRLFSPAEGVKLLSSTILFIGCFLVTAINPIGLQIFNTPGRVVASLNDLRPYVGEFLPLYYFDGPLYCVIIASVCLAFVVARQRQLPSLPECALWGLALAGTLSANRGAGFYCLITIALYCRLTKNAVVEPTSPALILRERLPRISLGIDRYFMIPLTVLISLSIIWLQLSDRSERFGLDPAGIGAASLNRPDSALKFLKSDPPPGQPLHVSWRVGLWIMFELFPDIRPYIDTRLQSYPRDFVKRLAVADHNPRAFAEFLKEAPHLWFVDDLEASRSFQRTARMLTSMDWALVHLDPVFVILVRRAPETAAYLEQHEIPEKTVLNGDFLAGKFLLPEQRRRLERFIQEVKIASSRDSPSDNLFF